MNVNYDSTFGHKYMYNDAAEVTTSQQASSSSSSSSVAVCGLTHDLFIMKQSGRLQTSFVLSVIQKIPNKNKNGVTWLR